MSMYKENDVINDLNNAFDVAYESVDSDLSDSGVVQSEFDEKMATLREEVSNSLNTVENCKKIIAKINSLAAKFNRCLTNISNIFISLESGELTKEEAKNNAAECMSSIADMCKQLNIKKLLDIDYTQFGDEQISLLREYIVGYKNIVEQRLVQLNNCGDDSCVYVANNSPEIVHNRLVATEGVISNIKNKYAKMKETNKTVDDIVGGTDKCDDMLLDTIGDIESLLDDDNKSEALKKIKIVRKYIDSCFPKIEKLHKDSNNRMVSYYYNIFKTADMELSSFEEVATGKDNMEGLRKKHPRFGYLPANESDGEESHLSIATEGVIAKIKERNARTREINNAVYSAVGGASKCDQMVDKLGIVGALIDDGRKPKADQELKAVRQYVNTCYSKVKKIHDSSKNSIAKYYHDLFKSMQVEIQIYDEVIAGKIDKLDSRERYKELTSNSVATEGVVDAVKGAIDKKKQKKEDAKALNLEVVKLMGFKDYLTDIDSQLKEAQELQKAGSTDKAVKMIRDLKNKSNAGAKRLKSKFKDGDMPKLAKIYIDTAIKLDANMKAFELVWTGKAGDKTRQELFKDFLAKSPATESTIEITNIDDNAIGMESLFGIEKSTNVKKANLHFKQAVKFFGMKSYEKAYAEIQNATKLYEAAQKEGEKKFKMMDAERTSKLSTNLYIGDYSEKATVKTKLTDNYDFSTYMDFIQDRLDKCIAWEIKIKNRLESDETKDLRASLKADLKSEKAAKKASKSKATESYEDSIVAIESSFDDILNAIESDMDVATEAEKEKNHEIYNAPKGVKTARAFYATARKLYGIGAKEKAYAALAKAKKDFEGAKSKLEANPNSDKDKHAQDMKSITEGIASCEALKKQWDNTAGKQSFAETKKDVEKENKK